MIIFKKIQFYFALWVAKFTALGLKLMGRKGTSLPGSLAIILCHDFFKYMDKPKMIVGITGTNGKTTTSNLVADALIKCGVDFVGNREGSNTPTGVASVMIANGNWFGKQKKQVAVFEIDERSSLSVFPYVKPNFLLITNIFRDSYRRNAHVEFICNILNNGIPSETKLILNGDDPLCSSLGKNCKKAYFSLLKQDFENNALKNLVRDGTFCPDCGAELVYDFTRYHHIGKVHCEKCGYTLPDAEYKGVKADVDNNRLLLEIKGKEYSCKLLDKNPINIYNQLSAIAILLEMGIEEEKVLNCFDCITIDETRYAKTEICGKSILAHLAKGQNPVACSRVFENIKNFSGKKCVVLFLDDHFDAKTSVENIAWYYDTDFEFLNDESITQILVGGARHLDVYFRLLLAGVDESKIKHCLENSEVIDQADIEKSDEYIICYDVYTTSEFNMAKYKLTEMIKAKYEGGSEA